MIPATETAPVPARNGPQGEISGKAGALNTQKLDEMQQELGPSFLNVIERFQAGLLTRPEKIRQAILANDSDQVAVESHSLKSVCRQIGLYRMGEMAATLESIGYSGQLEGANLLVEQLMQAGRSAHHELAKYCR